ncbi:hypothetical protein DFH08DRAFT_956810 [Mycena albidolilacea]|uniref:Uncharacterized protein n=1 Tax=Mycena albidolilacea TaxID=1033008 RepID=A0AAD7EVR7_9AGAR|nr:hypothetical protein DFH08DRAFT_956810 [Mycena albidolilacea]
MGSLFAGSKATHQRHGGPTNSSKGSRIRAWSCDVEESGEWGFEESVWAMGANRRGQSAGRYLWAERTFDLDVLIVPVACWLRTIGATAFAAFARLGVDEAGVYSRGNREESGASDEQEVCDGHSASTSPAPPCSRFSPVYTASTLYPPRPSSSGAEKERFERLRDACGLASKQLEEARKEVKRSAYCGARKQGAGSTNDASASEQIEVRARERWNNGSNGIVTTSFKLIHLLLAYCTQAWTSWSRPRPTPTPSAGPHQSIQSYQNDVAEAKAFPAGAIDWVKLFRDASIDQSAAASNTFAWAHAFDEPSSKNLTGGDEGDIESGPLSSRMYVDLRQKQAWLAEEVERQWAERRAGERTVSLRVDEPQHPCVWQKRPDLQRTPRTPGAPRRPPASTGFRPERQSLFFRVPQRPNVKDANNLPFTNAKRLALGLPLLPPRPRRAPTPRGTAASSVSILPPVVHTCNILVQDASAGQPGGYISPTLTDGSRYAPVQTSPVDVLSVTFSASATSHTQLTLQAVNGDPDLPTLAFPAVPTSGLIALACLIALAPPESSPSRRGVIIAPAYSHSETAIWSYDLVSQALTSQRTNSDGSTPQTLIYYDASDMRQTPSAPLFSLSGQTSLDGPN